MTPAPSLTLGRSPSASPSGTGQQSHGRPSGGTHNSGQSAPYSINEILALLGFIGYKGQNQANMAAVVMAESGGDPNAVNTNTDGSHDRGLFQINDKAHPDVSDACAFDPVCSANAAMRLQKGGGWDTWSSWKNGSARAELPAVEKAQKAKKWPKFQSEFAGDRLGQAGNAASDPTSTSQPQGKGKLFNCSNGNVQTTLGFIPTGFSLPDVGCYMESAFAFTTYAVGGLLLIGAGVLLIAHKNPVGMGVKAVGLAGVGAPKTAAQAMSGERLALQQQREARLSRPRPVSTTTQLGLDREARIAAREAAEAPSRERLRKAQASETMSKGTLNRANAFATRRAAKYGPDIGRPTTILGVQVPTFEVPGFEGDPSVMKG